MTYNNVDVLLELGDSNVSADAGKTEVASVSSPTTLTCNLLNYTC